MGYKTQIVGCSILAVVFGVFSIQSPVFLLGAAAFGLSAISWGYLEWSFRRRQRKLSTEHSED